MTHQSLPRIEIGKFNGQVGKYHDFVNLFKSIIDNDTRLSQCDKFYYLKTLLEGEAADVVQHLSLNAENYNVALQLLAERYDNKFRIINHHINSILDLPVIKKCSAASLRELVSKTKQHLSALTNLEVPTQHWDLMILCILQRKIDMYTFRCFHLELKDNTLPKLDLFLKFLDQRASALETVAEVQQPCTSVNKYHGASLVAAAEGQISRSCTYCQSKYHNKLHQCQKFKLALPSDRIKFVESNKLCKLCLNSHKGKCYFAFRCATCKDKHNTLIHDSDSVDLSKQVALSRNLSENILLPTVKVKVYDKNGRPMYLRALCDSGSQTSFILSDVANKIDCQLFNEKTIISGICGSNEIKQKASLTVYSTVNNNTQDLTCCVVKNITSNLPQFPVNKQSLNIPPNVQLADQQFHISDKISILLGCDIFFRILMREQLPVAPGGLYLHNTMFGYIVAGKLPQHGKYKQCPVSNFCSSTSNMMLDSEFDQNEIQRLNSIDNSLKRLWQCEEVPKVYTEASSEQELAEIQFCESTKLIDGRFEVSLPLKQDFKDIRLGDSLSRALQRFYNLEKRFIRDPSLQEPYKKFIDEYVQLGHGRYYDISDYNLEQDPVYFLPHHPVINQNSKTTKLRVVFDGSMLTNEGVSLNDHLLNGPCVQNDLFSILILFRLNGKYVFISDIKKMFRNIMLNKKQCSLQNILWRDTPQEEIRCIQLLSVTYGLRSSNFLATRCLNELAYRFKDKYPLGAATLLNNVYVDDVSVGSNDLDELCEIKKQLTELLKLGSFELHKWSSNHPKILQDIPKSDQNLEDIEFCQHEDAFVKTLGIKYNVKKDTFNIGCSQNEVLTEYTKRQILSFLSSVFDPLGIIGPIIVLAKIFMQQTWMLRTAWDQAVPYDLNKKFKEFVENLLGMSDIVIPRNIRTYELQLIELVGFSDASNKAYGSCLYVRTIDYQGNVSMNLLCSKSRINPMTKLTTPRLELNSALLLAKLAKKVYDTLKTKFSLNVYLYVDSTIVLAWLNTEPVKLSVYVANRVKMIRDLTKEFLWLYVNTTKNPADCLSRGVEPHLLQNYDLWWCGPDYFKESSYVHSSRGLNFPEQIPEVKICGISIEKKKEKFELLSKYSDINKLIRVIACIYRVYNICKKEGHLGGNITCAELDFALKMIIRCDQKHYFESEMNALTSNKPIKGNLSSLNPFIDDMGLLRVGGRLQHAQIPYFQKHPIILAKGSNITHLIIANEHKLLMHAGQRMILSTLSQRYYIVNGLREIKCVIHKCIVCFRLKAKTTEQLMGSLPFDRVNPCRAFEKVGIDYGGPFSVKAHRIRKPLIYKAYILIFVCFVTKAIHIELASNMTTECFLQCLKRFISRRNRPSIIYCDNAATFKGASNQLNDLYSNHSKKEHQDTVHRFASDLGIEFNFIPAYSPVFGGLWEAGIKSAKFHMKRVIGNQVLTYEELNSVIIQIEGVLNSRPLIALPATDTTDMAYLTPSHFLTGAAMTSIPEPDVKDIPINRLSFWKQCTKMIQCFWKAWHKQYLVQLQNRPKWRSDRPNLEVGTLVIVREDNLPPLQWKMARIVEVYPGTDGKVRALTVINSKGTKMRTSVHKVCVLPIE
ncbi:uncharacterized protein LOC125490156 isoform X2 [Plutella xylostella]|nr:uncharacterized protein LOC125490156 isoform X2 [Plutella xylostella]